MADRLPEFQRSVKTDVRIASCALTLSLRPGWEREALFGRFDIERTRQRRPNISPQASAWLIGDEALRLGMHEVELQAYLEVLNSIRGDTERKLIDRAQGVGIEAYQYFDPLSAGSLKVTQNINVSGGWLLKALAAAGLMLTAANQTLELVDKVVDMQRRYQSTLPEIVYEAMRGFPVDIEFKITIDSEVPKSVTDEAQ